MCAKKRSDGRLKRLESSDDGELFTILCGVDSEGVVRPILVDADGKIILST